jgi:hypothetical protein
MIKSCPRSAITPPYPNLMCDGGAHSRVGGGETHCRQKSKSSFHEQPRLWFTSRPGSALGSAEHHPLEKIVTFCIGSTVAPQRASRGQRLSPWRHHHREPTSRPWMSPSRLTHRCSQTQAPSWTSRAKATVVTSGAGQGGVRVIPVTVHKLRSEDKEGGEAVGVEVHRKDEMRRKGAGRV